MTALEGLKTTYLLVTESSSCDSVEFAAPGLASCLVGLSGEEKSLSVWTYCACVGECLAQEMEAW